MAGPNVYQLDRWITHNSGLDTEPLGYDITHPAVAPAYLDEVCGIKVPDFETVEDILELLNNEPRAAKYKDGRTQNVLEHTKALLEIAETDADKMVELGLMTPKQRKWVKPTVLFHDGPEAIGHDTIISDPVAMLTKDPREEASWTIMKHRLPLDHPYMLALARYRFVEKTGLWMQNPVAALVKADDKAEAYEFQVRDDVQAILHAERGEDLTTLFFAAIQKALINPMAMQRIRSSFVTLGQNAEKWGLKPFNGDPQLAVNYYTQLAISASRHKMGEQALAGLTNYREAAAILDFNAKAAERFNEAIPKEFLPQKFVSPKTAMAYGGKVAIGPFIESANSDGPRPTPPAPTTPGVAALLHAV